MQVQGQAASALAEAEGIGRPRWKSPAGVILGLLAVAEVRSPPDSLCGDCRHQNHLAQHQMKTALAGCGISCCR